jgi:hypothetical protein
MDYNKKEEARIKTAEMKFFRNVAGYIKKDQIRNTKIRERLKIFDLTRESSDPTCRNLP